MRRSGRGQLPTMEKTRRCAWREAKEGVADGALYITEFLGPDPRPVAHNALRLTCKARPQPSLGESVAFKAESCQVEALVSQGRRSAHELRSSSPR